nr:MAG TPA: Morphogenesis protein 1 hydrolase [Caudoviricetes sp.]
MQPYQRLYDNENNEVALFPMEYLHVSNLEHQLYAIDFWGWGANGRVYACPCYAPFSGSVVYTGNDHNMIYWSTNKVRFVDGTLDYATILVAHSDSAPPVVGTQMTQGDLWYYTGNYGFSTGDHLHMEVARGHVQWDGSGLHLLNPYHMYNMLACNDTIIDDGEGYDWRNYDSPTPPTTEEKKKKFPWFITANKRRNLYMN